MDDVIPPQPVRVSAAFTGLLTLAYVGAFIAFVPLLSLIAPLQAQALAPLDKVGLLSALTLSGAVTASLVNLAAGWVSDRTRSRFGRRRPWILAGLIGVIFSYVLIGRAGTPLALVLGFMTFQLAFNLIFAPLNAILPDVVPDRQKGRVAAFLGLGAPLGAASGILISAPPLATTPIRLAVLGCLVAACILPLLIIWREGAPRSPVVGSAPSAPPMPGFTGDFGFTWVSRFCLQITASIVNAYMLFYLADHVRYAERFPGASVESGLARLLLFSTLLVVAAGFVGGLASDRLGRRKPFIVVAAGLLGLGMLIFAIWPEWPGPLIGYAFYGLGFGLYTTVDVALVAQVLPSRHDAARDLGVMNLTNTVPTALAPLVALAALGPARDNWPMLMGVGGVIALFGGITVLGVRKVR